MTNILLDDKQNNNGTFQDSLDKITRILEEQLRFTRIIGIVQLSKIFDEKLRTNEDRMVYELSDGERSARDIEKLSEVGRTKIIGLWKKWYSMGLMEMSEKRQGRMKKSFSLSDFGIDVEMPKGMDETTQTQQVENSE